MNTKLINDIDGVLKCLFFFLLWKRTFDGIGSRSEKIRDIEEIFGGKMTDGVKLNRVCGKLVIRTRTSVTQSVQTDLTIF